MLKNSKTGGYFLGHQGLRLLWSSGVAWALPGATCPPEGPKWRKNWEKYEETWEKLEQNLRKEWENQNSCPPGTVKLAMACCEAWLGQKCPSLVLSGLSSCFYMYMEWPREWPVDPNFLFWIVVHCSKARPASPICVTKNIWVHILLLVQRFPLCLLGRSFVKPLHQWHCSHDGRTDNFQIMVFTRCISRKLTTNQIT